MRVLKGLALLMCSLILLTGCGSSGAQETGAKDQKMKVALLLSGPANDQGWNATALEGLKKAESKYGLETTYSENVGVADTEAAYNDYAARGYDLIIGHGFQFGDPAVRVAEKFPKLHFMATESNSQAENMASYVMSCEQGGYLMGMLSASMSKTGKIGVIGGIEQPSIIKELEAFKLGAKKVKPEIVVYEIYLNSFTDVAAGKDAALSMIDKGADVLYHVANQAGTGAIKAAEEKGILACGNSYDQNSIAPNTVICSTIYNMPTVILTAVDAVKNGTFKGGITHLGMKEQVVDISDYHSFADKIPEVTKKLIADTKQQIIDGTLTVPVIEKSTK